MNDTINEGFLTACELGDINKVEELYNIYYPPTKSIFEKFTNIFNFQKPLLDIHYRHDLPFLVSCTHGHLEIIKFLFAQKNFVSRMREDGIYLGMAHTLERGQADIVNFLFPFIKKRNQDFEDMFYSAFQGCCKNGNLDGVKYIIDTLKLGDKALNYQQGFITACENSQINIIEFFMKELKISNAVSVKNPNNLIVVHDLKVIYYFVNELDMKKDDNLYNRLLLNEHLSSALEDIWIKKAMHSDLISELNNTSTVKGSKKMKL